MKTKPCDCCEGTQALTPQSTVNRPGLNALAYRAGVHATFLETMKARLASLCLGSQEECAQGQGVYPLSKLTTRAADDPAIALLDAWATAADVLTFYQERIANEGYLRTATERCSVLEQARLVGYRLRPGVAASTYLAFLLEKGYEVEIPAGTRAQSVPGPGELPQSFETSEPLKARAEWNEMKPRLTQPTYITQDNASTLKTLYLEGISTNLKPNDLLLLVFGTNRGQQVLRRIEQAEPQAIFNRTKLVFQDDDLWASASQNARTNLGVDTGLGAEVLSSFSLDEIGVSIQGKPLQQLPSAHWLVLDRQDVFDVDAMTLPIWSAFDPQYAKKLFEALASAVSTEKRKLKSIEALRVKAALFGHNAPMQIPKTKAAASRTGSRADQSDWPIAEADKCNECITLDSTYDQIKRGGWIIIIRSDTEQMFVHRVKSARTLSRADYGITGRVTQLVLEEEAEWLTEDNLGALRNVVVYAQGEPLELADEPNTNDVSDNAIELNGPYPDLQPGRWVIVSGELVKAKGVIQSELAMIATVSTGLRDAPDEMTTNPASSQQLVDASTEKSDDDKRLELPGDTYHTTIKLDTKLAHTYRRDTVTIYGNVVKATHGETRKEVLGSGNGNRARQRFALKQKPLTYVAGATPSGAVSTLEVRVNDVRWHEANNLFDLDANDRAYITRRDDEDNTTILFGDGQHGARLPTGSENIRAVYRNGIGAAGNVDEQCISLLTTRPLGVRGVINPMAASGGADPETRDQARRNAPLGVIVLDRLVSVQDYADFARVYAGIGKASAVRLSDGRRQVIHLTIAGIDDIRIQTTSDLYQGLRRSLHRYGDPQQPVQIHVRELMLLVIKANVRLLPDYEWESVASKLRSALYEAFSFERRELGQDVHASEVLSIMQGVLGVAYVDLDMLNSITETEAKNKTALKSKLDQLTGKSGSSGAKSQLSEPAVQVRMTGPNESGAIVPAQLAILNPKRPETLILEVIP